MGFQHPGRLIKKQRLGVYPYFGALIRRILLFIGYYIRVPYYR